MNLKCERRRRERDVLAVILGIVFTFLIVLEWFVFLIVCFFYIVSLFFHEKIFNVFLAKSIPIYDGDPEVDRFINRDSYLAFDDNLISKINLLNNNESEYNKMINAEKTKQLNQKLIENYFDKLIKNKNK